MSVATKRPGEGNYDVIIVGGGFSGVSAAMNLQNYKRVLLLEAQDRLGGRAQSQISSSRDGITCDLGCHYVGVKHKQLMTLIRELGLQDQMMDYVPGFGPDPRGVCHLKGRTISSKTSENYFGIQGLDSKSPFKEKAQLVALLLGIMIECDGINAGQPWKSLSAEHLDNMSFSDFVKNELQGSDWMKDLTLSGVRGVWSQNPDHMSALYVLWYMRTNGGLDEIFCDQQNSPQQFGLRCGLGGLLQAWAKQLTADVELNSAVKSVTVNTAEDGANVARVETRTGSVYRATEVIITASPAVCDKIEFSPKVSKARQCLHEQPSGFAIKANVFYDDPWWKDSQFDGQIFAVLNGKDVPGVDWILEASEPSGKYHALVVFLKPAWFDSAKDDNGKVSKEQLGMVIAESVQRDPRAKTIAHFELKDWRQDPFVGGGPNTTFGVGVLTRVSSVFNQPDHNGCLYFAGAEYATEYTGYAEGAVRSGQFVAKQILTGITKAKGRGTRWIARSVKRPAYWILCHQITRKNVLSAEERNLRLGNQGNNHNRVRHLSS